ncbi:MAG: oligoendopeptidase F [Lentisphaerae bacterium GWF2_49_21]|nr:MAG: oligoendopeptidase F [Lentisphaerae bacterium GWF2_49_21]
MKKKDTSLPERSKIPVAMTWDLDKMYPDISLWERDFKLLDPLLADFMAFKGKLGISAETLRDAFKKNDALDRCLDKVYTYAHLRADENTADSKNSSRLDQVTAKYAEIEGETAWFDPEILALPEEKMKSYLKSPTLSFYKRTLEELLRDRPHTLSEPEEKILGMVSDALSTPYKAFTMLNNADIKFPKVPNGKGGEVELTHGNYIKLVENPNREIRKSAFEAMYDTVAKYRNTFAAILDGSTKTHTFESKIRNFPSTLRASLHDDNIPEEVYTNLIATVRKNLPFLHKYFELRKKVLKLGKLDMYDIYCPIVPDCEIEVGWDEACRYVKESLEPMGKEYCAVVDKSLNERWIDVLECRGKKSGAYSSGCYDSVPYVLMNFSGTMNDVFTLAHELGHSMHSYFSHKKQDYHYANYSIFAAEAASTTNELLLHSYLMEKFTDRKLRLYLVNRLAEEIRCTVYRQTMFAEFEKMIHEKREKGIPLSADELCSSYFKLNSEYHGSAVRPDDRIRMEWARIPHFYYNYYVYKYATGFSAAIKFSENILSGDKAKLDAYMGFLFAGDSKDVLDILRDAGVDLGSPEPIESCMKHFAETVKQLEKGLSIRGQGEYPIFNKECPISK